MKIRVFLINWYILLYNNGKKRTEMDQKPPAKKMHNTVTCKSGERGRSFSSGLLILPGQLVEASGGWAECWLGLRGALLRPPFLSRGLLKEARGPDQRGLESGRPPCSAQACSPSLSASQCRTDWRGSPWALRTRLLNPRLERAATCSTWKQNTLHK